MWLYMLMIDMSNVTVADTGMRKGLPVSNYQ